jgi:hypothetical protein
LPLKRTPLCGFKDISVRFLSRDESVDWASGREVQIPKGWNTPDREAEHLRRVRFLFPQTPGQVTWLCRFISQCLSPRAECLLWVTEWGVWPSSENWHLYYRLRQSYHDHRPLHEAPGHLFLDYEEPDLISYLQLGILNGWDMHLLPALKYGGADTARAFISHDEWIVLAHREQSTVDEWTQSLRHAELRLLSTEAA